MVRYYPAHFAVFCLGGLPNEIRLLAVRILGEEKLLARVPAGYYAYRKRYVTKTLSAVNFDYRGTRGGESAQCWPHTQADL